MKRILLTAFAILIVCLTSAQDWRTERNEAFKESFPYKYEARIGWGGYPLLDASNFPNGHFGGGYRDYDIMIQFYSNGLIDALYGTANGPEYMTGLISGEFSIHFKRWFTLAVEAGFNGIWGDVYDKYDGSRVKTNRGVTFTVMPHARFYWVNTKYVRMYSGIGLGVGLGGYDEEFMVYPAAQLSPVGITAGREIFFFAEGSIGTAYMGGKFGMGYRF